MLRRVAALLAVLLLLLWPVRAHGVEGAPDTPACEITQGVPDLEVFTRPGCPHCADAKVWLSDLQAVRPEVCVVVRDVVSDPAALSELATLSAEHGVGALSVPAFRVGDAFVVGFLDAGTTGARLEALLDDGARLEALGDEGLCPVEDPCAEEVREVDLPWFGRVDTGAWSLAGFTLVLGLLDGFNPCAMWVLLFLLSLLVNMHDRRRMALVAGTFVLASAVVYYAFMVAWLNLFLLVGLSRVVQVLLALVALGIGVVNVKDFFAFKRGISLTIPDAAKPGIARRARSVLRADNLLGSLLAVSVLALLVNWVELLCTAGLPAVYTQVLASHALSSPAYYGWIALYIVAYMLDDALMVGVAVVTLSKRRLEESGGRRLKLVSGLVMGALGVVLLARPAWLAF